MRRVKAGSLVWLDSRIVVLALGAFTISIGFGMVAPIMPFYATSLGASPTGLGILTSAFAITQFLLTPLAGLAIDRFGRKPFAFLGMFGFSIANVIYGLATTYGTLVFARAVEGAFAAAVMPAFQAYLADVTELETRGKASGLLSMGMSGGMILGPGLGGYLAHLWGFRLPFFACAALAALASLLVGLTMQETLRPGTAGRRSAAGRKAISPIAAGRGLKQMLLIGGGTIGAVFVLRFVLMFSQSLFEPVMALYTNSRLGWEAKEIGNLFTITGVVMMVTALVFGSLVDRWGRKPVLVLGSVLGAVFTMGLVLIGWMRTSYGLSAAGAFTIVMMVGRSAAANMRGPATNALVGDLVPQKERGTVMGALTTVGSLGRILGPFLGSSLYEHWHKEAPFALCAALLVMMTFTVLIWVHETLPKSRARTS